MPIICPLLPDHKVVENYAKIVDNLASNVGNLLQTESVNTVDAPNAAPDDLNDPA